MRRFIYERSATNIRDWSLANYLLYVPILSIIFYLLSMLEISKGSYRVVVKYCVFPFNVVNFLNTAVGSTDARSAIQRSCVQTHRGKCRICTVHTSVHASTRLDPSYEFFLKYLEKNTQYLMNTLYHDDIFENCNQPKTNYPMQTG